MKVISNLNAIAIAVVLLLITGIGATVFIAPAYAGPKWVPVVPTTGDVTGVWLGNDGGTYYLRQIGDVVWWVGLSGGNIIGVNQDVQSVCSSAWTDCHW
jgi:hypothetical protein